MMAHTPSPAIKVRPRSRKDGARGQQLHLDVHEKVIVDLFAGGGGASKGIEDALGRRVNVAINHSRVALAVHQANHPDTTHLIEDLRSVDPRVATGGRTVGYLHLSPDCRHHSQAAGGQPRDKTIRGLTWLAKKWAGTVAPEIISLENVEAVRLHGPLIAKRDPATGRVVKLDKSIAAPGERVPVREQFLVPSPRHAGKSWRRLVADLRALGYVVEDRTLCAADYGAPTTRRRLFLLARRDGQAIVWPEPSHAKVPVGRQQPWRSAAECIDWTLPGKTIFGRTKPLAPATLRRIALGIKRFVIDSPDPFIVPSASSRSVTDNAIRLQPAGGPSPEASRVAAPLLAKFRGAAVGSSILDPVPTITSGAGARRPAGAAHALALVSPQLDAIGPVAAFMAQMNGGYNETPGHDIRKPLTTVTNKGSQQQLVTAHMVTLRRHSVGQRIDQPIPTVTAGGEHHGIVQCVLSPEVEASALRVADLLIDHAYTGDEQARLRQASVAERLALATVRIGGTLYACTDVKLRMLEPNELFKAQSFPEEYIHDKGHDGTPLPKHRQVALCGNSVPPVLQAAVVAANCAHLAIGKASKVAA